MAETLPAMLREDWFAQELCASIDEVVAPVLLSMDTFDYYLDPATTPADMIGWLAGWLGLSVDLGADLAQQRRELQTAGVLNATRGTRRSLELSLESALGMPVEVVESGGARWSPSPGGALPGEPEPVVRVIVRAPSGRQIDTDRLDALVRSVKPAHVRHEIDVRVG